MKSPFAARPEITGDVFHPALHEPPLWSALYENLRDLMFPSRLPPLEITSKPVPVPNRMAVKSNPWAVGTSTIVNGLIVTALVLLGMKTTMGPNANPASGPRINLQDFPLFAPARPSSGGGGGSHDTIDPIEGRASTFQRTPLAPPLVPVIQQPKLSVNSAVDIRLPENSSMPNVGVHVSPNVTVASDGQGPRAGIGFNGHGGVGPGDGPGSGPGTDGGLVYSPGRGVVAPVPIYTPEAEFSDEARRAKYQGTCLISLIVDAHGDPRNLRVVQRLGMGLDEKALEAISRYRFKPGTKDGKPVPVVMTVAVDFHLF